MKPLYSSFLFLILILAFSFTPYAIQIVKAEEYPITIAKTVDAETILEYFDKVITWKLEYLSGSTWIPSEDLMILKTEIEGGYKYKLIFVANVRASYRLTFTINDDILSYSASTNKYNFETAKASFYYDWSDTASLAFPKTAKVQNKIFSWVIVTSIVPLRTTLTIDPITVGTSLETDPLIHPKNRHIAYANNRVWIVYGNGNTTSANTMFTSSSNYVDFTIPDVFIDSRGSSGSATSMVSDGTYIHYASIGASDRYIYYRRALANSDGTLTWSATEQTIDTGSGHQNWFPSINLDSNGYVYISYRYYDGTNYRPRIIRNDNQDGTWSTSSGFPYELNSVSSNLWNTQVIQLTRGKIAVIYSYGGIPVKIQSYDGASWTSETTASTNIISGNGFCAVNYRDDVYIIFSISGVGKKLVKWTYGTNSFGSDSSEISGDANANVVSSTILDSNRTIYAFWIKSANEQVWINRYSIDSGSWTTSQIWYTETANIDNTENINSIANVTNGKLFIAYQGGTSPAGIRFHYLSFTIPQNLIQDSSSNSNHEINLYVSWASRIFDYPGSSHDIVSYESWASGLYGESDSDHGFGSPIQWDSNNYAESESNHNFFTDLWIGLFYLIELSANAEHNITAIEIDLIHTQVLALGSLAFIIAICALAIACAVLLLKRDEI